MRIAYFDEAGTSKEAQEPYLVVGGALIHGDREWQPIEFACDMIIETLVPPELRDGFVFHAMHLHGGHGNYKGLLSSEGRLRILRALIELIDRFKLPISYGAISRRKILELWPKSKSLDRVHLAHQAAFDLCLTGFQLWFNRGPFGDEVAICVAAKNDAKNRQLHLKQIYQSERMQGLPGQPFTMLFNFVDALHFAAPSESFGLQLADIATFIIKRHLMRKDDTEEFYEILKPLLVCDPVSALWPMPEG